MVALLLHLQIILMMLIQASASRPECPCYCDDSDRMNCANQNLDTIPTNIPDFVTVINFQINKARHIKERTFDGLNEMVLLRMDSNKIHTIEPKAFFGMPKLDELVLNNNQIGEFDERMVDPRSPLKRGIKLDTNQLTKFPLNLLKRHRMSISVINNKIQCDCFTVIPSDLKEFVYGECHATSGRKTITSMTYTSANCQKCEHHKCVHGSCYLDTNGNALCQCFDGYFGESCEIDELPELRPISADDVIPTPSLMGSSILLTTTAMSNIKPSSSSAIEQHSTKAISEPTIITSTRAIKQLQPPSNSLNIETSSSSKQAHLLDTKDPYVLVNHIQLQTPNIKTGERLVINGCRFRKDGPPITRGNYEPVYIQDGWNIIGTTMTMMDASNLYQMTSLEFAKSAPEHVGWYRCGIRHKNGSMINIDSRPVYVSLQDVSVSRFRVKASEKAEQAEADQIKLRFEGLIQDLELGYPVTVQNAKIMTHVNGQTFWRSKILVSDVFSPEEKRKVCGAMHTLSETGELKAGVEILTPMDCCVDKEDNTPVAIDDTIKRQCRAGSRRTSEKKCRLHPGEGPSWLYLSRCPPNPTKDALKGLKRAPTCEKGEERKENRCIAVEEKASKLKDLVSKGHAIKDEEDVTLTADIVEEIAKNVAFKGKGGQKREVTVKEKVASDTLFAVNDIMKANEKILAKAQLSMNTSTKIVKSLEKISISIAKSLNKSHPSFTFTDSNLAMTISLVSHNHSSTSVVTYKEPIQRETTLGIYGQEIDFVTDKSMNGMVVLPETAVTSNKSIALRSVTYRKGVFFLNQHQLDNITSGGQVIEHAVGSNVLSVSIGEEERRTELEEPVTISFRNDSQSLGTGVIMFWDFEKGDWSGEGCWPINETKPDIISWNCSHLTNFALLINVNQDFNNPFALQLLTYIGGGISIGALLITLFIYLSIRKLRRRLAPRLLICLSLSLLLLLAAFIGLVDKTQWKLGCKIIAGAIQYLTLATFFWMFCEGINLYRNFVILFKKSPHENIVFVKMSFFAWGTPAVFVFLTVFLRLEEVGSKEICLVHGSAFYFGTLLPVGLILIFNWIVLVLAIRGMKTDKILHNNKRQTPTWLEIWRAFICSIILGLAWTFGIFAIGDLRDIFQWLFCVFNAFQGLFIFLLFVVKNQEVQKYILKVFNHSTVSSTGNSLDNATIKNGCCPASPDCKTNTTQYKHLSSCSFGNTNV
uniref:Uncharacterized protein n=1 Tax=Clytia hemisphaerica TaxID=252671 RepID=A0A7M5UNQ0_9CNID